MSPSCSTASSYDRLPLAVDLASLPAGIRGFGHVKAAAMQSAAKQRRALLARWRQPQAEPQRQRELMTS